MSTSGREVFIDGAALWMRGNSLGLLPNAWGAFNRLPLKELPLLRVQFFMDVARCFFLSQLSTRSDYARGLFIFSIKCLRECCSLLYCTWNAPQGAATFRLTRPPSLSVSLPASCKRPNGLCLGTASHKSLFQRDKATRPASLIHYFSIKIYCEQRARPLYYETRWKIE